MKVKIQIVIPATEKTKERNFVTDFDFSVKGNFFKRIRDLISIKNQVIMLKNQFPTSVKWYIFFE